MAYYSLQKIVVDKFLRNFFILSAIVNDTHAKNQDRSPRNISRQRQFFSAGFISLSRHFTLYFHFRCVARATIDRNFINSADACFLGMACVGYWHVQLKALSSLLIKLPQTAQSWKTAIPQVKNFFSEKPHQKQCKTASPQTLTPPSIRHLILNL